MINAPSNARPELAARAAPAEVTAVDVRARGPLLLLLGSAVLWLVISGVLALIAAIQLHSPAFLEHSPWFTHGRVQAMKESAFVYGWAANAGLAVGLWILGRLGGAPLRGANWMVTGWFFWNVGVAAGLVGIGLGDMTSFAMLQLPRYVLPLLVVAYAAIALSGVLAWAGRRTDSTYASQWYMVAALFLFPWLLTAAQIMLLWSPVRGALQAVTAAWFAEGAWTFWLAPMALAAAYYVVPRVTGRLLPSYDFAPLGFWTLLLVGAWTAGRLLVGGPTPAWLATSAVVAGVLVLFHQLVLILNLRVVLDGSGNAIKFIRFGLAAYVLAGVLAVITSFRGVAVATQFTFFTDAFELLGQYGAISMLFFGAMYFMVPRLTGYAWASGALTVGHRVLVMTGIVVGVASLVAAGWIQSQHLLDGKTPLAEIFNLVRVPLLISTAAQFTLLAANCLLLVNFFQSVLAVPMIDAANPGPFRQPSNVEAAAT